MLLEEEKTALDQDRGQTDSVTALPRPHALDSAQTSAAPSQAADDVTIETFHPSRQSILNPMPNFDLDI